MPKSQDSHLKLKTFTPLTEILVKSQTAVVQFLPFPKQNRYTSSDKCRITTNWQAKMWAWQADNGLCRKLMLMSGLYHMPSQLTPRLKVVDMATKCCRHTTPQQSTMFKTTNRLSNIYSTFYTLEWSAYYWHCLGFLLAWNKPELSCQSGIRDHSWPLFFHFASWWHYVSSYLLTYVKLRAKFTTANFLNQSSAIFKIKYQTNRSVAN